jgi:hypothetical protein
MRMSNPSKNRFSGFLAQVKAKPEEEKVRFVWFGVFFCMLGVLGLWAGTIRHNFVRLDNYRLDFSSVPEFPAAGNIDLSGVLEKSGEALEDIQAEDSAQLQRLGDGYIREKGLETADGFSSLKFPGSREEAEATVVEYGQFYKDLPVRGAKLLLEVDRDSGQVREKSNTLLSQIAVGVDPKLTLKEAGKIAVENAGADKFTFQEGTLVVVRDQGEDFLAWQVSLAAADGTVREVLVGAQRGYHHSGPRRRREGGSDKQHSGMNASGYVF